MTFNGQYFCEFRNRLPEDTVKSVMVWGDAKVFDVNFGSKSGVPPLVSRALLSARHSLPRQGFESWCVNVKLTSCVKVTRFLN